MRGAVLARGRLVFEVLKIVRQDQRGHATLGQRDTNGAVDEMPHLSRYARLHREGAGDVLEHGREIEFLLIMRAERGARLLADDREHRHVIHACVVKTGDQMRCAGPRRRNTDPQFASEFRVGARHERGHFLVTRLHEFNLAFCAIQRAEHAIDAVAGIAEHAAHAPLMQSFDDEVAYGRCHSNLPRVPICRSNMSRCVRASNEQTPGHAA